MKIFQSWYFFDIFVIFFVLIIILSTLQFLAYCTGTENGISARVWRKSNLNFIIQNASLQILATQSLSWVIIEIHIFCLVSILLAELFKIVTQARSQSGQQTTGINFEFTKKCNRCKWYICNWHNIASWKHLKIMAREPYLCLALFLKCLMQGKS